MQIPPKFTQTPYQLFEFQLQQYCLVQYSYLMAEI